ncbi:MAG: hypothetical protein LBG78_03290 [Azoarcus sp.]|jgi:sarcosine oxidase subunit gamma|nr:hypothetical protein [Azoarcus sp.]
MATVLQKTTHSAPKLEAMTHLPRLGLRGRTAAEYLSNAGFIPPNAPNRLTRAPSGELLLRLSNSEYVLLGAKEDEGMRVSALEAEAPKAGENSLYFLPRRDSHAWFCLSGERRVEVMSKLCGVDLSPKAFAHDAIAQTSVASASAIVAGDGQGEAFHLLVDSALAEYFQEALVDAMAEFGTR